MQRPKNIVVARIARAKLELDDALDDLSELSMLNPMAMAFIAHALNNYLRVSTGTVELLKEALAGHSNKQVLLWMDGLRRLNERMSHLVDGIQAKPRENAPPMNFEKIDLVTLVARACEFYRRIAARKRVEIIYEKPAGAVPKVRADRIAVAAVLDNLLSNATKHSTSGQRVWVILEAERDYLVCRVKDEAPGIQLMDRETLFRGDTPDSCGLAVAAELIAHMGGEINCESEPNRGACLSFRLPCRRVPAPSRIAMAKPRDGSSPG